jgi:Uma2 family endonuclease
MTAAAPRRASYAEYAVVPASKQAMIVNGVLHVFPRPAPKHVYAASKLGIKIGGPFGSDEGGPGGWWILDEPEVHLVREEPINPDLAGWTVELMPELPETTYFTLAPDWICEVLLKSTEKVDREEKMPIYAAHGVRHAWLVDPIARTLEVYVLGSRQRWESPVIHRGSARVHAPPFDAIELDLSALWVPTPRRLR